MVPEFERLKDKYELLWQMSGNESYLKLVGIMQKFVDQSISANTNYDPQRYEGGRAPMKQLLKDLLLAYKYGLKTLYYHNTPRRRRRCARRSAGRRPAGGACKI